MTASQVDADDVMSAASPEGDMGGELTEGESGKPIFWLGNGRPSPEIQECASTMLLEFLGFLFATDSLDFHEVTGEQMPLEDQAIDTGGMALRRLEHQAHQGVERQDLMGRRQRKGSESWQWDGAVVSERIWQFRANVIVYYIGTRGIVAHELPDLPSGSGKWKCFAIEPENKSKDTKKKKD